jgi:lauroyl/myristoyl acyltransferase
VADIIRDVLRAQEAAVHRDPANWFWVHKRWKPAPSKVQSPESRVENAGPDE